MRRNPKFTLGALRAHTSHGGNIFISEKCAWPISMCVKFQLSSSVIFLNENENENGEKRKNNEFVNES